MKKIGNVSMDPNTIVVAEMFPADLDNAKKLAKVLIDMCDVFTYTIFDVKFLIEGHTFGYVADIVEKAKYRRLKFDTIISPVIATE